jgi:hypothetical protein
MAIQQQVEQNNLEIEKVYKEIETNDLEKCRKEYCPCPKCVEIAKKNCLKWNLIHNIKKSNHNLIRLIPGNYSLYSRGIGLDWVNCFICGKEEKVNHNIAAFVDTKEDGDFIKTLFINAWHDYRPSEPKWDQLKIGACHEHLANLEILNNLIRENNIINQKMIQDAITPAPKVYAERIVYIVHSITNTILKWLDSDYCAYHIPMEDTIRGYEEQLYLRIQTFTKMNVCPHLEDIPGLFEAILVDKNQSIAQICDALDFYANQFLTDFTTHDTGLQLIRKTIKILFQEIIARKLYDGADRDRWPELDCGCGHKEFVTKIQYEDEGVSDVTCKNCGTKFWHHGSWVKSTKDGWQIIWDCRARAGGIVND